LASSPEQATVESRNTPHLVILSAPKEYVTHSDERVVHEMEIDFVARMMFMQIMHKAYAGTGSICTAVASLIPGTIANEFNRHSVSDIENVRIGHPGGILQVEVALERENGAYKVARAAIGRTARQIMVGQVFV
jgi:2-methylaconitate cis-trans-isomerase PrpF